MSFLFLMYRLSQVYVESAGQAIWQIWFEKEVCVKNLQIKSSLLIKTSISIKNQLIDY